MPTVIQLAQRYKNQLADRDEAALRRLIDAYTTIYRRLQGDIDLLAAQLADGGLSRNDILRMKDYKRMMRNLEAELREYQAYLRVSLGQNAQVEVDIGAQNATQLSALALQQVGASARLNRVPGEVIQQLLGFLDPAGPLYAKLDGMGEYVAEKVTQAILEGVGKGDNPRTIAARITDSVGMGLTDSMRMMRTAQLYAYRESSRATYVANSDVVTGWVWYAHLETACMSCVAMHGTEHPLDEPLDDHHNGECVAIPLVVGADNPIEQTGEEYFGQLPEEQQAERMGRDYYKAWQEGKFEFKDLSATHVDDVYGDMRSVATLGELTSWKVN